MSRPAASQPSPMPSASAASETAAAVKTSAAAKTSAAVRAPVVQRTTQGPAGSPRRAPRTPFALLVGGLVVGGMCALLALNTASAANELARHDLATKDADISAQVQQLQNEIQASAAPGNLAAAAAALGMVPAGNPAFLRVGPDGSVRVLGVPAPATLPTVAAPPKPTPTPTPTRRASTTKKKKPAPRKTPTPTPTPTTELPGGTR